MKFKKHTIEIKCKVTKHRSKISQRFEGKNVHNYNRKWKKHTYVFQTIHGIMYKINANNAKLIMLNLLNKCNVFCYFIFFFIFFSSVTMQIICNISVFTKSTKSNRKWFYVHVHHLYCYNEFQIPILNSYIT